MNTENGQRTFCVSPDGDDRSPGAESRPFRTIERARDEIRRLNRDMGGDITVLLRGGVYELRETLAFDQRDGATNGHRITYQACPGETPVLSGGRRITGWKPDAGGRWRAETALGDFRQLYVKGRRAERARGKLPDAQLVGPSTYRTTLGAIADWHNPSDIELCYEVVWCHTRCRVASICRDGDAALITMQEPYFTLARKKEGVQVDLPTYIENALELLTQPGQWHLDRRAGVVYYMPRPGEDMAAAEVIAPALETILLIAGTRDSLVHDLSFIGLRFSHGSWLRPSRCGLIDIQANYVLAPDEELRPLGMALLERNGRLVHVHHEYPKSPANVVCRAARGVRFVNCTFAQLGGAGLDIERGARDNVVAGCEFRDIAGTAIQIGDVLRDDHHPNDDRPVVRNNRILNCRIHDAALDYKGGVGIFVGYADSTRIAHNEICDLPYSGMSIGWGWGEEDAGGGNEQYYMPFRYDTPTPAQNNVIECNHIHHVMQELADGGAIYTLGRQPGTVILCNYIHHSKGAPGGVYLDEGSGGIEVTGNLVHDVPKPMNFNNHVQNRIATCPARDNSWDGEWTRERTEALIAHAGP